MNKDEVDSEDALDALLNKTAKWIVVSYLLGAAAALVWGFLW